MMVAAWALRAGDRGQAAGNARSSGMPDAVIERGLQLLDTDRPAVERQVRQWLTEAGAPIPPWAGGGDEAPPGDGRSVVP